MIPAGRGSRKRWILRSVLWVGGVVIGTLAVFVLVAVGAVRRPEVTRNLPVNVALANAEFQARLERAYPVGMSVERFERMMAGDHFTRMARPIGGPPVSEAFRYRRFAGFYCNEDWIVSWEARDGRLLAIRGFTGMTCL